MSSAKRGWWLLYLQCWQCLHNLVRRLPWSFPEICWRGWVRVGIPVGLQLLFGISLLCCTSGLVIEVFDDSDKVGAVRGWYIQPRCTQLLRGSIICHTEKWDSSGWDFKICRMGKCVHFPQVLRQAGGTGHTRHWEELELHTQIVCKELWSRVSDGDEDACLFVIILWTVWCVRRGSYLTWQQPDFSIKPFGLSVFIIPA